MCVCVCLVDHQGLLRRRQAAAPLPPQTEETPTIKLSPIKEASLEAHTTLSTAGGASTLGVSSTDDPLTPQTGTHASLQQDPHWLMRLTDVVHAHTHLGLLCQPGGLCVLGEGPLSGDPCSGETRRRLLDQAEVSSFPGYHTVEAPLPPVDKDTHLSLGERPPYPLSDTPISP